VRSAYILVKVRPNKSSINVLNKVENLPIVKEAVTTYGEYDLLIKVNFSNFKELTMFIYDVLRLIPEAGSTTTMVVAKMK